MNVQLQSNASSALVSALDSVSQTMNPFVYQYGKKSTICYNHVPSHAKTVVTGQSTGGIGFNQNIDFPVIKSGMLTDAFLKVVVTNSSGAAVVLNSNIGNLQVAEINLMTSGKIVATSKPFGRACLMSQAPYGRRKNLEALHSIVGQTATDKGLANGSSLTFYVPLGFSCFESLEQNYNTSFVENLVVRVRLREANAYSDNDTDKTLVALSLTSCELVQCFSLMPADLEQKQIQANFGESESLTRVQYDLIEESTTKTAAAAVSQVFEHTITSNRVINKLFIALEGTTDAAAAHANSRAEGGYLPLSNIKIEGNGQTIIDLDGDLVAYALNKDMCSSNLANAVGNHWDSNAPEHTKNIYCFDLGYTKNLAIASNALSAREINSLKITATSSASAALTANPYNLRICMICPQLESINAASGKISTSLSS